eukprot:1908592-Rhodomonas_salina.1
MQQSVMSICMPSLGSHSMHSNTGRFTRQVNRRNGDNAQSGGTGRTSARTLASSPSAGAS